MGLTAFQRKRREAAENTPQPTQPKQEQKPTDKTQPAHAGKKAKE